MAAKKSSGTKAAPKQTKTITTTTATAAVPAVEETEPKGSDKAMEISNTYAGSPVTGSAGTGGTVGTTEEPDRPKTFAERAEAASIGLVRVEGIDFRYVGVAPGRDKGAETPSGYPISTDNTRFTPLSDVPFDPSIRCKVGDEYCFPPDGATSWADVEGLVPAK